MYLNSCIDIEKGKIFRSVICKRPAVVTAGHWRV